MTRRVSGIGEFGLIARIRKTLTRDASVVVGSGDDCAVLEFSKDKYQLFTCDMLVEGVDFKQGEKPYLVGRKALALSISDIAACGGLPRYAVVSLGLPKSTPVRIVDGICHGMRDLARRYKVHIVGGDLSRAPAVTLDVSMLGLVEKKRLVLRNGAKTGDVIFVSGSLGGSIRGKHLCFEPRVREARFLVEHCTVHAMCDISDGLAQDLRHILRASKKGARLYQPLIPVSKDARAFSEALFMGEDFELLFTMPRRDARRLLASKHSKIFRPIGEITAHAGSLMLVDMNGKEKSIQPKGFRHF